MDLNLLWKNSISEVEIDLGKNQTRLLLANSSLLSLENNVAVIAVANPLALQNLEKKYYVLLQNALIHQTKLDKISLLFEVKKTLPRKAAGEVGPLFDSQSPNPSLPPTPSSDSYPRTGLNPRYKFESLIVGSSNNFAHAAAITICKNPGREYNPFFIYGGVGVGKTHLMQAVGNDIYQGHPHWKILYTSAENFMNDLVASLQSKTMSSFKKKYREVDMLLIDDIQFISGKESMQEEFFHCFNSLFMAEKQIILTSDRPPEEIKVQDRLQSRLMGGLTADIQPPDLEMRMAIINEKLKTRQQVWHQDAVEYLATQKVANVREIEGALQRIFAQTLQSPNKLLDLATIKNILGTKNGHQEKPQTPVSPQKVLSATSKVFGIKQTDILSSKRDAAFVLPRQVTMYLLREEQKMGFEAIAAILNRKDHTTVMHAVTKISTILANNPTLRQQIMLIKRELWG